MHHWAVCHQPMLKRPEGRAHGFDGSVRLLGFAQALLSLFFSGFGSEDRVMSLEFSSVSE